MKKMEKSPLRRNLVVAVVILVALGGFVELFFIHRSFRQLNRDVNAGRLATMDLQRLVGRPVMPPQQQPVNPSSQVPVPAIYLPHEVQDRFKKMLDEYFFTHSVERQGSSTVFHEPPETYSVKQFAIRNSVLDRYPHKSVDWQTIDPHTSQYAQYTGFRLRFQEDLKSYYIIDEGVERPKTQMTLEVSMQYYTGDADGERGEGEDVICSNDIAPDLATAAETLWNKMSSFHWSVPFPLKDVCTGIQKLPGQGMERYLFIPTNVQFNREGYLLVRKASGGNFLLVSATVFGPYEREGALNELEIPLAEKDIRETLTSISDSLEVKQYCGYAECF